MALHQTNDKENDTSIDVGNFRDDILTWYKKNARELPWRAKFGEYPDPYYEWLSEIMLQQTVVKAVIPYFIRFISLWPTVHDLAKANQEDIMKEWAGLGYYARARNLHKCAQVISEQCNGVFPQNEKELLSLPGIGSYTAAAIISIAFGKESTVVDGNIERIMARIFAHKKPIRDSKKEIYAYASYFSKDRQDLTGEYAQALMDLGANICTPSSPKCLSCPIQKYCNSYIKGYVDEIPIKTVKSKKLQKYGTVFFIENENGELLFEKRPEKGLLGGMISLPGTEWNDVDEEVKDKIKNFQINHTFTHFHLSLNGLILNREFLDDENKEYFWKDICDYDKLGLPTLYKKALKQYKKYKENIS